MLGWHDLRKQAVGLLALDALGTVVAKQVQEAVHKVGAGWFGVAAVAQLHASSTVAVVLTLNRSSAVVDSDAPDPLYIALGCDVC
jgi:hypothetical protein